MVNCIILAAGESKRMGKLKPFLLFDKEITFLEYLVRTYIDIGIRKLVIVVNERVLSQIEKEKKDAFKKCQLILNSYPEKGRFYSLKLGLQNCQNPDPVFIQNVDNPFINVDLLQRMVDSLQGYDFIVPQYNGKTGHPVLLSQKLVKHLLNNCSVSSVFSDVLKLFRRQTIQVDDPKVLLNVNTPEDYLTHFSVK